MPFMSAPLLPPKKLRGDFLLIRWLTASCAAHFLPASTFRSGGETVDTPRSGRGARKGVRVQIPP